MVKKAFKKRYLYSNPEKYRIFLKKVFTTQPPRWYSVAHHQEVETADGPMQAVKIVLGMIENPALEAIAEVWVNGEYVYLWREYCWTIAVDKNNAPICQSDWNDTSGEFTITPPPCHKTMLLHQVGSSTV